MTFRHDSRLSLLLRLFPFNNCSRSMSWVCLCVCFPPHCMPHTANTHYEEYIQMPWKCMKHCHINERTKRRQHYNFNIWNINGKSNTVGSIRKMTLLICFEDKMGTIQNGKKIKQKKKNKKLRNNAWYVKGETKDTTTKKRRKKMSHKRIEEKPIEHRQKELNKIM